MPCILPEDEEMPAVFADPAALCAGEGCVRLHGDGLCMRNEPMSVGKLPKRGGFLGPFKQEGDALARDVLLAQLLPLTHAFLRHAYLFGASSQ